MWLAALLGCVPTHTPLGPMVPTDLAAPVPYQWHQVNGHWLAVADSGGEGEAVVLVHGLSSHAAFWQYQVEPLVQAGYRVIVPDLPGYGASDRPDAPYTPPWFAAQLVGLLDRLELDQIHYVGHSMGGQIGLTLALENPDRVASLTLAAPAGIETFRPGHAQWMREWWTEGRALEAGEDEIRRSFRLVFRRWDDHVETLLQDRVRLGLDPSFKGTSVAVSRSVAGMLDYPVRDRLDEIVAPTLVVFGRQDGLIPNPIFNGGRTARVARDAKDAIAGAHVVLVGGAGHTVMHDAPDPFNTALLEFLSHHPLEGP